MGDPHRWHRCIPVHAASPSRITDIFHQASSNSPAPRPSFSRITIQQHGATALLVVVLPIPISRWRSDGTFSFSSQPLISRGNGRALFPGTWPVLYGNAVPLSQFLRISGFLARNADLWRTPISTGNVLRPVSQQSQTLLFPSVIFSRLPQQ